MSSRSSVTSRQAAGGRPSATIFGCAGPEPEDTTRQHTKPNDPTTKVPSPRPTTKSERAKEPTRRHTTDPTKSLESESDQSPRPTPNETNTQLHSESAVARGPGSAAWVPMVSVGKLSAGQAKYYLDQTAGPVTASSALTSGAEDYYLGGPKPPVSG
jgi:hypothetical protein